ncbi:MAG: hypothetical protein KDD47_20780 [Acidobacteria bacterium]|nr:hypothetical protein [Acidobacteriota bacterium]
MEAALRKCLTALEKGGVRYLIVGGVAVVLHGHLRATADLDLVLHLEPENVQLALEGLGRAGFEPVVPVALEDFAEPEKRRQWKTNRNMLVFSLWHPDDPVFKVDIFVEEPLNFEAAWERRVRAMLPGLEVSVVDLEDLITLKEDAGRPQDLADVHALRRRRPT